MALKTFLRDCVWLQDLAAELYTEDAELHMGGPPAIGKAAIRKGFEGQAKLRADGKMRLR